jgi:beta-N-acetylhexosaminidase
MDHARDAHAVLLPAFDSATFDAGSAAFFENGGVASLLGSTRSEYVARRMSAERAEREAAETFQAYAAKAAAIAGNALIAVDYEIGGVHRLHRLGPQLPHPSVALEMSESELEDFGRKAGRAARDIGVNLFLAPVVDVVTGPNPWLLNRTLQADPKRIGRIASAFVRGVQAQRVAATAKHFPGHHAVIADPFHSADVTVGGSPKAVEAGLVPFRDVIASGVKAIMTGPIPIDVIDPNEPASTSRVIVHMLRAELSFRGLIVSDDIDLPGTLRGRTVPEVAVKALKAGVELLLLASGPQVKDVIARIVEAVETGELPEPVLKAAASRVRSLAAELA